MKYFDCPSCLQPSFSVWQKLKLGPARKIQCPNCGAEIGVPWLKSMFVIILSSFFPPLGAIVPFIYIPQHGSIISFLVAILVGTLAGLFMLGWLYSRWVPLVAK
jgi:VIT1/CCC1 family predicted Fe2+/Mn2+ transporter